MPKLKIISPLLLVVYIQAANAVAFKEATDSLEINFIHHDDRQGKYHFTETSGSGVAWIDYDHDGDVDLLLLNGSAKNIETGDVLTNKLFNNNNNKFTDVSAQSGLPHADKAFGVCAADINADGTVDIYITHFGQDYLYLNQHDQQKETIFKKTVIDPGAPSNQWSTSCAFGDVDNDGDVDLYVTRYVDYSMNGNTDCVTTIRQGYCNPSAYAGLQDGLFINDGSGHFTEQAKQSGIIQTPNDRGFGVVMTDFDNDQDLDIYVANDGRENRLYVNDGSGNFKDNGMISGTAINLNGKTEAGMGVALGDINNDGFQDLLVTHFSMETNTLYMNRKNGFFSDVTNRFGMLKPTYLNVGWGVAFTDIDNDGFQDIITANGFIDSKIKEIQPALSYEQPNLVMMNQNGKKFKTLTQSEAFTDKLLRSSRGLATGDINNDGLIDLAISNASDSAQVYINQFENDNNWIGFQLTGTENNRSAIGAKITIQSNHGVLQKEVHSGGSFLSQSDFRVVFGLGNSTEAIEVQVTWPDSKVTKHLIKQLNQYHLIER